MTEEQKKILLRALGYEAPLLPAPSLSGDRLSQYGSNVGPPNPRGQVGDDPAFMDLDKVAYPMQTVSSSNKNVTDPLESSPLYQGEQENYGPMSSLVRASYSGPQKFIHSGSPLYDQEAGQKKMLAQRIFQMFGL